MKEEWEWREGINVGKRMEEEDRGFRGVYKDWVRSMACRCESYGWTDIRERYQSQGLEVEFSCGDAPH